MPPNRHPEFIGKLSYQLIGSSGGLASFPKVLGNCPAFALIALDSLPPEKNARFYSTDSPGKCPSK
jgi:hypothetical protein